MQTLIRKALTKPMWHWERRRPYPVRSAITKVAPVSSSGSTCLIVLTTPGQVLEAAWSVMSFLKTGFEVDSLILIDGEASELEQAAIRRVLPSTPIQSASTFLSGQVLGPNLTSFVCQHTLGKKLAILATAQRERDILYADSDLLMFRSQNHLPSQVTLSRHLVEEQGFASDKAMVASANKLGLSLAYGLNSGLLAIQAKSWDEDHLEALLEPGNYAGDSWFCEQTAVSVMMGLSGSVALPKEEFVVSNRRQFYFDQDWDYSKISCRHFTGPVRHLMYLKGYPALLRSWQREATP